MKLFIPACGDRLTLTEPWTFTLYLEHRNVKFAQAVGLVDKDMNRWSGRGGWDPVSRRTRYKSVQVTLEPETIIECDRVYIRQFNKSLTKVEDDFDSITWKVMDAKGKAKRNQRFWVKLSDCNGLDYRLDHDSVFRDRVKLVKEVMES